MGTDEQVVSMLDLERDTEELVGFQGDADANQTLPPVPAGTYDVKVTYANPEAPLKGWTQAIWGSKDQKVWYLNVLVEVVSDNPLFNGRMCRDMVSTFIYDRTGTCSAQGLLQALGYREQVKTCRTNGQMTALLNDALSGDARAQAVLDWEAAEKLTPEERLARKQEGKKIWRMTGMTRFPKDGEGNYIPEVTHDGQPCPAYNIVKRWVTQGDGRQQQTMTAPSATAPQAVVPQAVQPTQAATNPTPTPAPAPTAPRPAGAPIPAHARQGRVAGAPVPAGVRK